MVPTTLYLGPLDDARDLASPRQDDVPLARRGAAPFVVHVAEVALGEVDVRLVALQHPLADVRQFRAAVLNPAVRAVHAELDLQLEVLDGPAAPDEEVVLRHDLLRRGLTDDLAVLDPPVARVAIPAVQRLPVEDRHEPRRVVRLGLGKDAAAAATSGLALRSTRRRWLWRSGALVVRRRDPAVSDNTSAVPHVRRTIPRDNDGDFTFPPLSL